MADLDPYSVDQVSAGLQGRLFNPDNLIAGKKSAENNWGIGHYTTGEEYKEIILDRIRAEVERCDCIEGFQIVHSISAGTGGGLGTRLLSSLREEYPNICLHSTTLVPSPNICSSVLEPYNAVLSMHHLIENANLTHLLHNEAIQKKSRNVIHSENSNYEGSNHLIASMMSNNTACIRFPCEIGLSFPKLEFNLVLFPRIHFLMNSIVPITSNGETEYRNMDVKKMTKSLFNLNDLFYVTNQQEQGYTYGACTIYRGETISPTEIDKENNLMRNKESTRYKEWIPRSFLTGVCDVPPKGIRASGALILNNSSFRFNLKKTAEDFTSMFRRKAFLHFYTGVGMDEMEFVEAESNMNDLLSEYIEWRGSAYDDYYIDEEEEVI